MYCLTTCHCEGVNVIGIIHKVFIMLNSKHKQTNAFVTHQEMAYRNIFLVAIIKVFMQISKYLYLDN